jgi:hypothetical protein
MRGLRIGSAPETGYSATKQNAPDPEDRGPMRLGQGLLPCQFILRYKLPVF